MFRRFSIRLGLGLAIALAPVSAVAQICFLQPFGGTRCIDPNNDPSPLGVFGMYFNMFYPWLVGVAAGLALLMVLTGGINIIQAGGDQGKRQEGIERLKWAIIGLLFLLFANVILQTLNPTFFK